MTGEVDDRAARARALLADGDPDGALAMAEAWVAAAPHEAEAHNTLGIIQIARRDWHAAKDAFLSALALDSSMAKAFSNLGGVLREQGDLEGAENALRRAVELDPTGQRGWTNLG